MFKYAAFETFNHYVFILDVELCSTMILFKGRGNGARPVINEAHDALVLP